MAKLVIELQKDCLNSKVSLTELLRKARFIAQKLDIAEMIDFCTNELEGYTKSAVPKYRWILVTYKFFNPYGGWSPFELPSTGLLSKLLKRPMQLSIGEMEQFLQSSEDVMTMGVPAEVQTKLCEWSNLPIQFEIKSFFSKTQFAKIFDSVKNKVSDWAIDLERKGILGDEYQFTEQEKRKASDMTVINNYGNINGSNFVGSATNSMLNVNNTNSFDYEGVEKLLESVQKLLPAGNFTKDDLEKIQQDIDEIKESISKQNVPAVKGKLKDLADFCKGIAGNVIASGVWAQIQPFLY
jgi:hypothetical protein